MGIFKLNGIDYMGGGGGDVSKTELTQAEYNALVEAGTVDPEMMYFITDGPGSGNSGSYTTLLWTNETPTSGMSANTTVTIPNLTAFDLIGIVATHNVTNGGVSTNAMQIFSTNNTTVDNILVTANSGNASNYARTFTITNDTTLTFSDGMQPGIAYNSNYTVPLKIYGLRFGNGGSGGSNQHIYSTEEQVVGTWIDGSDVYEKTFYIASLAYNVQAGTRIAEPSFAYIDKVVSINGTFTRKSNNNVMSYKFDGGEVSSLSGDTYGWTRVDIDDFSNHGILYFIRVPSGESAQDAIITIRYTKTTT